MGGITAVGRVTWSGVSAVVIGADARLFHRQLSLNAHIEVPPWIEPVDTESLAEYAARMTDTIQTRPPFYLGGCSFGGMIALEVARHIEPKAIILMGSCRTPISVNQALLGIAPLARLMPKWMLRLSSHCSPQSIQHDVGVSSKMLRWGPRAIIRWKGVSYSNSRIHQIHGGCDRIIPARNVAADQIVRTAGHLINLTHSEDVNRFITDVFRQTETIERGRLPLTRMISLTPFPPPTPLPTPRSPSQT